MEKLLGLLQENSRISLARLSAKTGRSIRSVKRCMKGLTSKIQYSSLLNFWELGYYIRSVIAVRASDLHGLRNMFLRSASLNNLFLLRGDGIMADMVFRDMAGLYVFLEGLEQFGLIEVHEYHIIEEIDTEIFYTNRKKQ